MLSDADVAAVVELAAASDPHARGGNSTITRVEWSGYEVAVKDYSARTDGALRLSREYDAVNFLEQSGLSQFPRPLGWSPDTAHGLYTWVEGVRPSMDAGVVDVMLETLADIDAAKMRPEAAGLRQAADAAYYPQQLVEQVRRRLESLVASPEPQIRDFALHVEWPDLGDGRTGLAGSPVPTLSPSDFGLHNMLMERDSGVIVTLDLEFFGWDDAHKLVCDTVLHPMAQFTPELEERLIQGSSALWPLSPVRLALYARLLALKWSVIVCARAERMMITGGAGQIAEGEIILVEAQRYSDAAATPANDVRDVTDRLRRGHGWPASGTLGERDGRA